MSLSLNWGNVKVERQLRRERKVLINFDINNFAIFQFPLFSLDVARARKTRPAWPVSALHNIHNSKYTKLDPGFLSSNTFNLDKKLGKFFPIL